MKWKEIGVQCTKKKHLFFYALQLTAPLQDGIHISYSIRLRERSLDDAVRCCANGSDEHPPTSHHELNRVDFPCQALQLIDLMQVVILLTELVEYDASCFAQGLLLRRQGSLSIDDLGRKLNA